jgi:predicted ATPase/signal transduction histidine kinase
VILKIFGTRQPHPKDIARLDNEYRIASQLDSAAVVRPLALELQNGIEMLVLEDFGGEPLERMLGGPMEVGHFLDLAIRIATSLAEVHRRGVIHKDIKPENILVNETNHEVKITDFGIAALLPREQPLAVRPSLVEGTLAYMSPEQTGRMNRPVDPRSDLYSLGVVFYRMLTGRPPFEGTDALEWIHCHIARSPVPPSDVAPGLPTALSDLVLKLLAKDPEQRYQNAVGLKHDLERCLHEWHARGRIDPFVLGEQDAFDRFRIPQRLYGRESVVAMLFDAFRRVVSTGRSELILVRGYSGIGKSSVVRELHKHVVEERGIYVEGKFEQRKSIPYAPILQALTEVVLDILAEGEERRDRWRTDLTTALGSNGKLMVDVIPELALVIGEQPRVPELPRSDAEVRFRRVFRDFIGVFARAEAPLVLFLDDLQWLDTSSLALIEDVVGNPDTRNLLVIGAYRDNEVGAHHPLVEAQRRLRDGNTPLDTIVLSPLGVAEVAALVADAMRIDVGRTRELATVIQQKTGGNPFFVIQVLKALRRENLLWFDEELGDWRWELSRIQQLSYTDNVVDLLVRKLVELSVATQETLQIAACIGNKHSLEMLALACSKTEDVVLHDLWDAVREGLVVLSHDSYAFVHDRMQQAAYSLIPAARRSAVHLRIGKSMRDDMQPQRRDEWLFDIVTQLNLGASLVADREERTRIAELDLLAGRKARSASAFRSALDYFTAGAALLDDDAWADRYELKYALELDRAECELLTGTPDRAKERLDVLLERARNRIDKAAAYEVLVAVHLTRGNIGKDIEVALSALRLFEIDMSPHPSWNEVVAEYEAVWRGLHELRVRAPGDSSVADEASIEDVVHLPRMTDSEKQISMRLLSVLFGPAYWSDLNLLAYHICKMVNLSLRHGNTAGSAHAYGWFGVILCALFHRYEEGYRWARAGYDLMARAYPAAKAKAEFFMETVSIWTQSIDAVIEHARAAVGAGFEVGDVAVTCWSRTHIVSYRLLRGDALEDVEREATDCLEVVRKVGVHDSLFVVLDAARFVRALRGSAVEEDAAEASASDTDTWLAARQPTMVCWHHVMSLMTRFMLGDYEGARAAGEKAERLLWASLGCVQVYDFHFYYALTLATLHARLPSDERVEVERKIRSLYARLLEWSMNNPPTFSSGAALVAAEIARLYGDPLEAARGYEHAAELARSHGFVQIEALAYELASRFYRDRGIEAIADGQLREARDCYVRWGAAGKVAQLERCHPQLRRGVLAAPTTMTFPSEQIDLLAVAKASQTISREIVWNKVTETLLKVVLEQSGAQKGCLLFPHDGALRIELEAAPSDRGVEVTSPALPLTDSRHVPSSVIEYARTTKSPVLLEDATRAERFRKDPYLARSNARSVLCLPILLHGHPVGLVYLENSLVAGAFTRDRLAVLELLAAQAAISLSNAQLLSRESAARATAEEAERRAAFLAQAGQILNESLDYVTIPSRLARLIVGAHADWCSIKLLENGRIRDSAHAHANPEMEPLLGELIVKYPPRIDSPLPGIAAIRTGAVQLLTNVSDEGLRRMCADEEQARLLRTVGMRNILAVPLVARGKTLGAMVFVRASPSRTYGPAEVGLAQDLAYRAAFAVDNARLHRETQEAVQIRNEFLAIASHELNTPMTALVLTLQALLQKEHEVSPEKRHELAKMAERQAGRLTRLIGELLDVTRIERGKIRLSPEKVDLEELVNDGVTRFASELARAQCTVSVTSPGPIVGEWDRSRIEQVVVNLLANAAKFGAGKPIDVTLREHDGSAYFEVTDHGIGIDAADQARIFDRFERAVSVRHYGGLGLGLYICQHIIEAHGGAIRVRSTPGAGATFTVELPCVARQQGQKPEGATKQELP